MYAKNRYICELNQQIDSKMSEEIIPEVNVEANVPSDVPEPAEMAPVVEAAAVNYQEMGIPELVAAF